jgi:hypothetical protein
MHNLIFLWNDINPKYFHSPFLWYNLLYNIRFDMSVGLFFDTQVHNHRSLTWPHLTTLEEFTKKYRVDATLAYTFPGRVLRPLRKECEITIFRDYVSLQSFLNLETVRRRELVPGRFKGSEEIICTWTNSFWSGNFYYCALSSVGHTDASWRRSKLSDWLASSHANPVWMPLLLRRRIATDIRREKK